jgi:hypothetical protein
MIRSKGRKLWLTLATALTLSLGVAHRGSGQTACVQPPSGAIAWWSFDETTGDIAADRTRLNPGTLVNSPLPSPGEVGGAYRFNGTNYVLVQNSPLWHFGANDFSIELWANFVAPPQGSVGQPAAILVANDEGSFNVNKWFFAVGGGFLYFSLASPQLGPHFFPLVPFSPAVGQWYHLAVTRTGSTFTVYINGVASGTATNTSVIPNPNAPLTIAEGESIGWMNGLLDEVTIYNRGLLPEEISAIYTAGSGGKCVSLQVTPSTGTDTGILPVTVTGHGFEPGATVSLVRTGQPDIVGAPITVGGFGTAIATTFDLGGKALGPWDVVVTNPDGASFTLPQGFTIQAVPAAPACVQPPSGLIAWWSFDETTGNIAADRTGLNPGSWANGPVPSPGEIRNAYRFNGTNYVVAANSPLWHFGAHDFSIELWANFTAAPGGSVGEPAAILIANDEGPFNANKWFFAVGGGVLYFALNGPQLGPQFIPLAPFSPVVGQWYHLALTRTGSTYTVYIDGIASGSATNAAIIPDPNAPLTIAEGEGIGFMNGLLDEVTVYDRALQPEEVAAVHRAGSSGKCISLQITPNTGGDTGSVSVTILGEGLQQGAKVSLVRAGQPSIAGAPVTVENSGTTLSTTFNLSGMAQGAWDVLVMSPDGSSQTLSQGFTIQAGTEPQVWVNVVSLGLIVPGRPQTVQLFYGNSGNVDAVGVPLWIAGIPPDATVQTGFNVMPPPPLVPGVDYSRIPRYTNTGTQIEGAFLIPKVVAESTSALPVSISIPQMENFQVQAWTNPPWFDTGDLLDCSLAILGKVYHVVQGEFSNCAESLFDIYKTGLSDAALQVTGVTPNVVNLAGAILNAGNVCIATPVLCGACFAGQVETCVLCEVSRLASDANDLLSNYNDLMACGKVADQLSAIITSISAVSSFDPNGKAGPQGVGQPGWVSPQRPLTYAVLFQNLPGATAPAQQVVITDQLDPARVDLSTLRLGPISFAGNQVVPPPASTSFAADVDLRPAENLLVRITSSLDPNTGLLTWRFASIDPATGNPPLNPELGFLPADVNPPQGEGSALFTVLPKQGATTGTQIHNQATIVFDANAPLSTQAWLNTMDNDPPTSSVAPLPPNQVSTTYTVQWSGTDVGSGIRDYTIFVSDNGGAFTPFLSNTPATSATFSGQRGHSYGFYSIARDLVGNLENPKNAAEATTEVVADTTPPATSASLSPPPNANGWNNSNVTVNLTSTDDEPGGTGVKQVTYSATGAQQIGTTNVAGSAASLTLVNEGTTTVTFFATDNAGNQEAAKAITVKIDKTSPTIIGNRAPAPNANGWNNTDVTVSFTCSDSLSGLAPGSPPAATVVSTAGPSLSVTGTCSDLAGNSATQIVQGINIDKTPPNITCGASPVTLWPPNHKLVPIGVSVSVSDALSGSADFLLNSVTSNEPDSGEGDIQGFVIGTASTNGELRAERLGSGSGRVYTLVYVGMDRAGNSAVCTTTVTVPHDRR